MTSYAEGCRTDSPNTHDADGEEAHDCHERRDLSTVEELHRGQGVDSCHAIEAAGADDGSHDVLLDTKGTRIDKVKDGDEAACARARQCVSSVISRGLLAPPHKANRELRRMQSLVGKIFAHPIPRTQIDS